MHKAAIFAAHQVFEEDSKREGKIGDGTEPLLFELVEAIDFKTCAPTLSLSRVLKEFAAEIGILNFLSKDERTSMITEITRASRGGYNESS